MLIERLLELAGSYPNRLTVQDPVRRVTYGQLSTLAKAIRRLVLKETTSPQVGIMLPASTASLGTILGVLWSSKIAVPLNFLLQSRELAAVIADAQIDLVISTEHFKPRMNNITVRTAYLEHLGLKRRYLREKLARTPDPPDVSADDIAAIVYTSGTTGQPKGACLTYNNLISNCRAAIKHFRLTPDNHILGVLPPFHVFGLTLLNFLPIILAAKVTFIPRFSPQATYQAIAESDISILLAVPSMYAAIARLKSIEAAKFNRLAIVASGGEALPRQVYDQFHERTGIRIMQGYGITETSPVISADVPWSHRVGTVGKPLSGVEIQVRDDIGRPVGSGEQGELFVRGPLVMKGYFNRPEETQAVIDQDGWFRTGDIVRVDEQSYISITDRAKDMIIVGGENVFPREVESVLDSHPAVAESAVVGRTDDRRGEVVIGFVTLKDGQNTSANELREFCRAQLAGYKVPREIRIQQTMPRGPTGKILKRQLKSLL